MQESSPPIARSIRATLLGRNRTICILALDGRGAAVTETPQGSARAVLLIDATDGDRVGNAVLAHGNAMQRLVCTDGNVLSFGGKPGTNRFHPGIGPCSVCEDGASHVREVQTRGVITLS